MFTRGSRAGKIETHAVKPDAPAKMFLRVINGAGV
jgi:hypothetical protein